jgi:hypothetical protein
LLSFIWSCLLFVLIGSQYPDERLNVDEISRAKVTEVASDLAGKSEKTGICLPRGSGSVEKIDAIFFGGETSYGRFQEDVSVRLSNETEHGRQWPSEYAALFAGQSRENVAPTIELNLEVAAAVKKSVETFREIPSAGFRLKRVANCHLFKGKRRFVRASILTASAPISRNFPWESFD